MGLAASPSKFLVTNSSANGFVLSDTNGASYIPNTLIAAISTTQIASIGGAPSGYVMTSQGSSAPGWAPVSLSGSSVTGTLTLGNGGTGGLVPQTWGVVYASSATQLATTDPAPVGFALISNASSAPSFQQLNLALAGSGILPQANGGTGTTVYVSGSGAAKIGNNLSDLVSAAAAIKNISPMTTWGDTMFAGSGLVVSRLAPGVPGQFLQSNGPVADPQWANALSNPMTIRGDFIYAGTSAVVSRLAAGAAGTVLTSQGTQADPTWTSPLTNPMTTLGDMIYAGSGVVTTRLIGTVTNSSAILTQTGSGGFSAAPVWTSVKPPKIVILNSSGVFTPDAGVIALRVTVIGPGGGGGGAAGAANAAAGSGGGGGGGAIKYFAGSSLLASYTYVTGAGGLAGTAGNNNGGAGSSTVFGTLVAPGGAGGSGSATSAGGFNVIGASGGAQSVGTGDLNFGGGQGGTGFIFSTSQAIQGKGGDAALGFGYGYQTAGGAAGQVGAGYGCGGSGGSQVSSGAQQAGAAGQPGIIKVELFFP